MKKNISRRNFFNKTLAASTVPFIIPKTYFENVTNPNPEPSLKNKKILFVYGGWKGHFPQESKELFVPFFESEGAIVTLSAVSYTHLTLPTILLV